MRRTAQALCTLLNRKTRYPWKCAEQAAHSKAVIGAENQTRQNEIIALAAPTLAAAGAIAVAIAPNAAANGAQSDNFKLGYNKNLNLQMIPLQLQNPPVLRVGCGVDDYNKKPQQSDGRLSQDLCLLFEFIEQFINAVHLDARSS